MAVEKLTVVFRHARLSVKFAVEKMESLLKRHKIPPDDFELSGRLVKLSEVSQQLQRARRNTFHLHGQGYDFRLSSVRNHDLDFIAIKSEPRIEWEEWASAFCSSPDFVMAWVADAEYEFWQNAHDPLQYTSVGRSYANLPMVSNGLPYPLEQKVIDTSANPGRRILRRGYIEAVGAIMWLGDSFWELTGKERSNIRSLPWLEVRDLPGGVVRIGAAKECFTTSEAVAGKLQTELRALLYPERELEPSEGAS
jgi:hypothetical protein